MIELRIGSVNVEDAGRFAGVLGNPPVHVDAGAYELVGRLDERKRRFESAALTRNLGNDQWSVHLLNVQQLSRLAQSELVKMRTDSEDRGSSLSDALGSEAAVHVAAHLLGVGMGVALVGSLLESSAEALGALTTGVDPRAQRVAEKLSLEGVDPGSKASVRKALGQDAAVAAPSVQSPDTAFEPNRNQRSNFALEIER